MLDSEEVTRRSEICNRGEKPIPCCSNQCLQKLDNEDCYRTFKDAVFFRSLGQQAWHGFIKTLYLSSIKSVPVGSASSWPVPPRGSSYQIPSCRSNVCRIAFLYLLGLKQSNFYSIVNNCIENPSVVSSKHALTGRINEDSNKKNMHATTLMKSAIRDSVDENGFDAPWSKGNIEGEIVLKLLPPGFCRDDLFRAVSIKIPEESRLSRSTFYRILGEKEFTMLSVIACLDIYIEYAAQKFKIRREYCMNWKMMKYFLWYLILMT